MRVAILSSSLGFGHVKAATAVEEKLREQVPGVEVEHIDFWALMDDKVAAMAKESYLNLVTQAPDIYDNFHCFDRQQWREFFGSEDLPPTLAGIIGQSLKRWLPEPRGLPAFGDNLDQTLLLNMRETFGSSVPIPASLIRKRLLLWMHRLLVARLKRWLQGIKPDLIVATQMMPASLLSAISWPHAHRKAPVIAVLTDYGVHDFWINPVIDHYCVAAPSMTDELQDKNTLASEHSISVTGIPLMKGFSAPPSQNEARARLGCGLHKQAVMITGGGYGIGAASALEQILASDLDCEVLVAAEGRQWDGTQLRELAGRQPGRVHVFRENIDMPAMIRAADIVVGKPGGLSVSEALACGRPFLAVCSLGGQENFNVAYLEAHNLGGRLAAGGLIDTLRAWLTDPLTLSQAQSRAWALGCRHGAEHVVNVMLSAHLQNEDERQVL